MCWSRKEGNENAGVKFKLSVPYYEVTVRLVVLQLEGRFAAEMTGSAVFHQLMWTEMNPDTHNCAQKNAINELISNLSVRALKSTETLNF